MKIEIIKDGKIIHTSKNLRGILDYARVSAVKAVRVSRDTGTSHYSQNRITPGGNPYNGILEVEYFDGAVSGSFFASFTVLCGWVKARRCFRNAGINIQL